MQPIISKQREMREYSYRLVFSSTDRPSAGYSFPCARSGEVDPLRLTVCGRRNLRRCLDGTADCGPGVVRRELYRYTRPLTVRCRCGAAVECRRFTNTCDCGLDYNRYGQLLAPRDQWGWDTGESVAEILAIP